MNSATIQRQNYNGEFTYFIPTTGKDWKIESMSPDYAVKLSSESDSTPALQSFLDNHAVLTVNSTKAVIQANGADSVTWSMVGQTTFAYSILKENIQVASGLIVDSALVFSTDEKGHYLVELKVGSQTGYAVVEAI